MTRIIAIAAFAALLTACETIEGFGEDVQAGGAAIEDTAQDAQN